MIRAVALVVGLVVAAAQPSAARAFTPVAPASGSHFYSDVPITLSWGSWGGHQVCSSTLTLDVATDQGFANRVYTQSFFSPAKGTGTTSKTLPPLPEGTYYWRTKLAIEACGIFLGPSDTWTFTVDALPPAPAVMQPPTIAGSAREGQALTAAPGTWTGLAPITYAYQWERCDAAGTACSAVPGATLTTYVITLADIGTRLTFSVVATNRGGTTGALAQPTEAVLPLAPVLVRAPSIAGVAKQGKTIALSLGAWRSTTNGTLDWTWLRCDARGNRCVRIASATKQKYKLTASDAGHRIRARVVAANAGGTAVALTSATAVVTRAPRR